MSSASCWLIRMKEARKVISTKMREIFIYFSNGSLFENVISLGTQLA